MTILIIGLVLFLGIHMLPTTSLRDRLTAQMGAGAYRGVFSLISIIGLALIVYGYGLARQDAVVLWEPLPGLQHLTMLLMVIAFILLVAAYVPGKIRQVVGHPMVAAVKVWALAHLLANGTNADLLLFGGFMAWGVLDRISLKKRQAQGTVTVTGGPAANDIISLVLGATLYVVFALWLHDLLFGVPLL